MSLTYTVIISYSNDQESVELTESSDRAAMHVLARRIARDATAEISSVYVLANGETFSWRAGVAFSDGAITGGKTSPAGAATGTESTD